MPTARLIRICFGVVALWITALPECCLASRVEIPSVIELPNGQFFLADLLPVGTCPSLVHAAAQVRLGDVPAQGIPRILDGSEVRQRLQGILANRLSGCGTVVLEIPERVVISHRGIQLSCSEFASRLLPDAERKVAGHAVQCGLDGVRQEASLELLRKRWDPALQRWNFLARCVAPKDCVPFLMWQPNPDLQPSISPVPVFRKGSEGVPVVHAGEKTNVIWNQDGIRLVLPGISLAPARAGQVIRVQLRAGRIVSATVAGPGTLFWSR